MNFAPVPELLEEIRAGRMVVIVDDEERQATVIVPDDQLSLAIGRNGQNVRLASELTGWKIDIVAED